MTYQYLPAVLKTQLKPPIPAKVRDHIRYQKVLGEAGVPCGATLDTADLYDDPHLNQCGFIKTLSHPEQGGVANPARSARRAASAFES